VSFMVDVAASARLLLGFRLFLDVATSHVHYDLRDARGGSLRVLEPFGATPGLALLLAWRS